MNGFWKMLNQILWHLSSRNEAFSSILFNVRDFIIFVKPEIDVLYINRKYANISKMEVRQETSLFEI